MDQQTEKSTALLGSTREGKAWENHSPQETDRRIQGVTDHQSRDAQVETAARTSAKLGNS